MFQQPNEEQAEKQKMRQEKGLNKAVVRVGQPARTLEDDQQDRLQLKLVMGSLSPGLIIFSFRGLGAGFSSK